MGGGGSWNGWLLARGEFATAAGADSSSSFRGCFGLDFFGNLRWERLHGCFLGGLGCGRVRVDVREGGGANEGEGVGEAFDRKDGEGEER